MGTDDTKDNIQQDQKALFTKDNPHPSGAWWDSVEQKWKGYKATKGFAPPWNPFNPANRKKRVTINEKKFLMVLSTTGSINEAFRAVYKVTQHEDKRIENARVNALGNQVLDRLRKKAPDLVASFTFEDITPDFIKKEMKKLYESPHSTIAEKTRLLELMGKTQALFTDKVISDTKIREVVEPVYQESDDDFSEQTDSRVGRIEIDQTRIDKIPVA